MSNNARPHTLVRRTARGLLALSAVLVAGCGGDVAATPALSAETFCSDFMQQPAPERAAATTRIAGEVGAPDPSSADWIGALEARCAAAPDLKLGDFFNHFK